MRDEWNDKSSKLNEYRKIIFVHEPETNTVKARNTHFLRNNEDDIEPSNAQAVYL